MAQEDLKLLFQAITAGTTVQLDSLLSHHSFSHEELNSGLIHSVKSWSVPSHPQCMESLLSAGAFLHTRDHSVLIDAGREARDL